MPHEALWRILYFFVTACALTGWPGALVGHNIAYRRGYLKTGFVLGLLGGLPGASLALLLPPRARPLMETEWALHYRTRDYEHRSWVIGVAFAACGQIVALMQFVAFIFTSPAGPPWPQLQLCEFWGFMITVFVGSYFVAICVLLAPSRPSFILLPPLPESMEPGNEELNHWIGLRWQLARLKLRRDNVRGGAGMVAITGILTILYVALMWPEHPSLRFGLQAGAFAGALALVAAAFIGRFAKRYEPEIEDLVDYIAGSTPETEDHGHLPLEHGLAADGDTADFYLRWLNEKSRELFNVGSGTRTTSVVNEARGIAAASIDASTSARRYALAKPAAAIGGGWLIFKLATHVIRLATNEGIDSFFVQQYRSGPDYRYYLFVVLPLVLVLAFLLWVRMLRRAKRPLH